MWDRSAYAIACRDPDAGAMPDSVFWGIGPGSTGDGETLYRHDETGWQRWSLSEARMLASWGTEPYAAAPDGSFWAAWPGRGALGTPDLLGVNRFDGRAWQRYLPSLHVWPHGMAIAPDGSTWLIGWEGEEDATFLERRADSHLYVITPEPVAATE